jgi:hypothetical protein
MTDTPSGGEPDLSNLTVEQAIRLKHKIAKSITYGPGLNSRQILDLQKLDREKWAKVRRDYDEWHKSTKMQLFLLAVAIVSAFGAYRYKGWVSIIAFLIAFYSVGALFKRDGHREGYFEGYEAGYEEGIFHSFGIDDNEATEVHKMAVDMEIDEMVIEGFDKRRQTGTE